MKTLLQSSEWALVGSLLLIMASLATISKVNVYRAASTIESKECQVEDILIAVSGAVKKPGEYRVAAGTPLAAVLRKARPLPNADLAGLPLKEPLQSPRAIFIPELSEITVFVSGAVQAPVELTLPVTSRISDLKSKVALSADADKSYFRRKRRLKNREKIVVPKKTVEENSAKSL